jgi:hypothetical protein
MDRVKDSSSEAIRQAASKRVFAVLKCLDVLVPDATPRQRKKLAKRILTLCDGQDRSLRITQAAVFEMVQRNVQCIAKNCPLLIFAEPLSRELNLFFERND